MISSSAMSSSTSSSVAVNDLFNEGIGCKFCSVDPALWTVINETGQFLLLGFKETRGVFSSG